MANNRKQQVLNHVFDTNDTNSDTIFWPGGDGVLAVQGDAGAGTVTLQALLGFSLQSVDPDSGTFGTVTDETTSNTIAVTDPAAAGAVKALKFSLPACWVRMRITGATSPDVIATVGRSVQQTD